MTKINRTKTVSSKTVRTAEKATRKATKGKEKELLVKKGPKVAAEGSYKSQTEAVDRTGTKMANTKKPSTAKTPSPSQEVKKEIAGVRGRKSTYAGKRLVATAKDNPAREGTGRREAFAFILKGGKTGVTYEDYRAAELSILDLRVGIDNGFVAVK